MPKSKADQDEKPQQEAKRPVAKGKGKTLKPVWNCEYCTLENMAPNDVCEVCQNKAADSAYYPEEEAESKEAVRPEEAKEKEGASEELKQQQVDAEAERRTQVAEMQQKTKESQQGILKEVKELIETATAVSGGIQINLRQSCLSPLILGVAFNNDAQQRSVLRLRRFAYAPRYLSRFFKHSENGFMCTLNNEWVAQDSMRAIEKALFQDDNNRLIIETIQPIFVTDDRQKPNGDDFSQKWLGLEEFNILVPDHHRIIDMVVSPRAPDANECCAQETMRLSLLTVNLKTQATELIQYDLEVYSEDPYEMALAKGNSIHVKSQQVVALPKEIAELKEPQALFEFRAASKPEQLIVASGASKCVFVLDSQSGQFTKYEVQSSQKAVFKMIDEAQLGILDASCNQLQVLDLSAQPGKASGLQAEKEVKKDGPGLIDVSQMSMEQLSNLKLLLEQKSLGSFGERSTFSTHFDQETGLNSKHTWIVPGGLPEQSCQLVFQAPSEILSLDIDIQLEQRCKIEQLDQLPLEKLRLNPDQLSTNSDASSLLKPEQPQKAKQSPVPGLDAQKQLSQDMTYRYNSLVSKGDSGDQGSYIPLMVMQYTGGVLSAAMHISNVLTPDKEVYASAGPNSSIVFQSLHDKLIVADSFTIRSSFYPQRGGFPLGAALIFASNTLSSFSLCQKFDSITEESYSRWLAAKLVARRAPPSRCAVATASLASLVSPASPAPCSLLRVLPCFA